MIRIHRFDVCVASIVVLCLACGSPLHKWDGFNGTASYVEPDYEECQRNRAFPARTEFGPDSRYCTKVASSYDTLSEGWREFSIAACKRHEPDGCELLTQVTVPQALQPVLVRGWTKDDAPERYTECIKFCDFAVEAGSYHSHASCELSCDGKKSALSSVTTTDQQFVQTTRDLLAHFCEKGDAKQYGSRGRACVAAAVLTIALDGGSAPPGRAKTAGFGTPERAIELAKHGCTATGDDAACALATRFDPAIDVTTAYKLRRARDAEEERKDEAAQRAKERAGWLGVEDRAGSAAASTESQPSSESNPTFAFGCSSVIGTAEQRAQSCHRSCMSACTKAYSDLRRSTGKCSARCAEAGKRPTRKRNVCPPGTPPGKVCAERAY